MTTAREIIARAARLYPCIGAYAAVGLLVFGYASSDEQIRLGCPTMPSIERGLCYQSNAYYAVAKGLVWPVYYPASAVISVGRALAEEKQP